MVVEGETYSFIKASDVIRDGVALECWRRYGETNNPAPVDIVLRHPDHAMHPVLPLRVEVAWATADLSVGDSKGGANYAYEFAMLHRGWRRYLQVGMIRHPHGGVGFLEYRNLPSNYFGLESRRQTALGPRWAPELGRRT